MSQESSQDPQPASTDGDAAATTPPTATKPAAAATAVVDDDPVHDPMPKWAIHLLGGYLVALCLFMTYLMAALWPQPLVEMSKEDRAFFERMHPGVLTSADEAGTDQARADSDSNRLKIDLSELRWSPRAKVLWLKPYYLHAGLRVLLLVALAGALGSLVHSVTSFVSYVGNERIGSSWAWWYLLRPCIGMALALLLYFAVRGGLIAPAAESTEINLFGVLALSGLAGLFSRQASEKLKEMFETLFRTRKSKEDELKEKLNDSVTPGSGETTGREAETTAGVKE